jgi:hypothetical protein
MMVLCLEGLLVIDMLLIKNKFIGSKIIMILKKVLGEAGEG